MKLLIDQLTLHSKNLGNNSKRLFHGRGKCFKGFDNITIDWFSPFILVDLYGDVHNLDKILLVIEKILNNKAQAILYRNRQNKPISYSIYKGEIPEKHFASWNNLKFEIDFKTNQNIGFFLESENLRNLVALLSYNKNVLNLFSYTCSLSVIAKANHAKSIMNIDMNKGVLKIGQKNHFLSALDTQNVSFLSYNIIKSLKGISKKGSWDLIIIDPPSFQGKSFEIKKDFEKLIKAVPLWSSVKCDLILCINSPFFDSKFLKDLCDQYLPNFIFQKAYFSPVEFVEMNREFGMKIIHLCSVL